MFFKTKKPVIPFIQFKYEQVPLLLSVYKYSIIQNSTKLHFFFTFKSQLFKVTGIQKTNKY